MTYPAAKVVNSFGSANEDYQDFKKNADLRRRVPQLTAFYLASRLSKIKGSTHSMLSNFRMRFFPTSSTAIGMPLLV